MSSSFLIYFASTPHMGSGITSALVRARTFDVEVVLHHEVAAVLHVLGERPSYFASAVHLDVKFHRRRKKKQEKKLEEPHQMRETKNGLDDQGTGARHDDPSINVYSQTEWTVQFGRFPCGCMVAESTLRNRHDDSRFGKVTPLREQEGTSRVGRRACIQGAPPPVAASARGKLPGVG
jgi:hypothetical protein